MDSFGPVGIGPGSTRNEGSSRTIDMSRGSQIRAPAWSTSTRRRAQTRFRRNEANWRADLMWVLTTQGFYSVVEDRDDENRVLVRARAREDLEALKRQIPDLQIYETPPPDHDYGFRA